jgi:hypothetical protein
MDQLEFYEQYIQHSTVDLIKIVREKDNEGGPGIGYPALCIDH